MGEFAWMPSAAGRSMLGASIHLDGLRLDDLAPLPHLGAMDGLRGGRRRQGRDEAFARRALSEAFRRGRTPECRMHGSTTEGGVPAGAKMP
jgi:hypothetical protein